MFSNIAYENIKKNIQPYLDTVDDLLLNTGEIAQDFDIFLLNYLKAPSKKIRSVISLLFFKALGYDITDEVIKVIASVEIIHNASLIHDDIIDKADIRRDFETFNSKFDNSLAVISGDYLLYIALKYLLEIKNFEILNIFTKIIEKMCVGEISQYFNKYKLPTIEEYIEKSKNKTASLFIASFEAIAVLYNFDKDIASEFAANFGIAFQIRDDILNFTKKDNKPVKNDYEEGIYTAPVIYAEGKIENLSSGIEKAKVLLDNYLCNCRELADKIVSGDNIYKNSVLEILDLLKL